jgi:hypothetical protein
MKLSVKNWSIKISFFLLCFLPLVVEAEEGLFFPIDRSDIKVLPQQFNYDLINLNKFRIGDSLFDSNKINFQQLEPKGMRFTWPAALLTSGEISLRDNIGKIIWQKKVTSNKLKITRSTELFENENLKNDIASVDFPNIDSTILTRIQTSPFIKFCVQKDDGITKFYLCSPEFFFKKKKNKYIVAIRNIFSQTTRLSINGQEVGEHGTIYLQSTQDAIFLNATFASGASLDLITRLKKVDFRDIYKTSNGQIQVLASGAEPTSDTTILKKTKTEWLASLDEKNSYLYLSGEGGIPLKQDFYFEKPARPESLKLNFSRVPLKETYNNSEIFYFKPDDKTELIPTDKDSSIKKITDSEIEWTVKSLQTNQINRRYVILKNTDGEFVGAWDIFRAKRNELNLRMGFYPIQTLTTFKSAINQSWNFEFGHQDFSEHSPPEPSHRFLAAEIDYKFTPGLNPSEKSHSIFLSVENQNLNSSYFQTFSSGFNLVFSAPSKLLKSFDFLIFKYKMPLGFTGSEYSMINSSQVDIYFRKKVSDLYWDIGAVAYSISASPISNGTTISFTRINGFFGLGLIF